MTDGFKGAVIVRVPLCQWRQQPETCEDQLGNARQIHSRLGLIARPEVFGVVDVLAGQK